MLKYSFILIGIYFLYYAGNIVYDLFLKKEKTVATDESEEFSLVSFARTENPPESRIQIEDVENIRAPKSFLKSELHPLQNSTTAQEQPDLEELRKRFEAEEDIDELLPKQIESVEINHEGNLTDNTIQSQNIVIESAETSKIKTKDDKKKIWKDLFNLSETSVVLVANYEGQKVYHSTI